MDQASCAEFDERAEAVLTKPEVNHVSHAVGGDGRAGDGIDLVISLRALFIDTALDYPQNRFTILVDLLADPLRLPVGVVDFTTQPRGFAMLVEAQAGDGLQVTLQRHETVHGRPQTVATHWQHQAIHLAVLLDLIDHRVVFQATDRGDVLPFRNLAGQRCVGDGLVLIEGVRVVSVAVLASAQVDQTWGNARGEHFAHVIAGHTRLPQFGDHQHRALAVDQGIFLLGGTQNQRRGRDRDRTHQAHHQSDDQGACRRFFNLRHYAPASA